MEVITVIQNDYVDLFEENFSFWKHLSNQEKILLSNNTTVKQYTKGSCVHNGNDDCIGILLVKSGQLRTYILSENGRDVTLFRMFKGDICILSASCIIELITFDVVIDTEEDTELILINASVFNRLIQSNVYVENFAYKLAVTRFSDVMWTMEQILFMGADKRLAIFLWDEISKNKNDEIKLTHEQIARFIGSAREVVSRMLKYFALEDIVEISRGSIKIIDKAKLRSLT